MINWMIGEYISSFSSIMLSLVDRNEIEKLKWIGGQCSSVVRTNKIDLSTKLTCKYGAAAVVTTTTTITIQIKFISRNHVEACSLLYCSKAAKSVHTFRFRWNWIGTRAEWALVSRLMSNYCIVWFSILIFIWQRTTYRHEQWKKKWVSALYFFA